MIWPQEILKYLLCSLAVRTRLAVFALERRERRDTSVVKAIEAQRVGKAAQQPRC